MWRKPAHATAFLWLGLVGLLLLASCNIPEAAPLPLITPTGLISDTGPHTLTPPRVVATTPVVETTVVVATTPVARATAIITDTPSAASTVGTPTTASGSGQPEQCGYMWANQELPDVSAQVNQALTQASLSGVQARASAYGENCLNAENKVVSFSAMQTDFYLSVPVKDTNDTQAMGEWIAKLLPILANFPPGQVPGPNLGNVGFQFKNGSQEQNLWFPLKKGQDLLQQGTTGSALFQALKTQ